MRYAILGIIGFVLLGAVIFMLKAANQPAEENPANDGNKVVVAKTDLQPGNFIVIANDVAFVEMDEKDIKPNYIQKKDMGNVDGSVVRNLIKANEPIQKDKIVTPKEGGFLSAVLYPGKRAISVGVDVVSANAGFIFPGDKVDLLLTHEVDRPEGGKSYATETFVEDVRVLAIDQQVNNPDHKALVPKTVTLEVSPKQAEEVLVAQELGKISLILRSSGSVSINPVTDVKTYTKDNEVSKVIEEYRPNDEKNIDVTITRGKTQADTKVAPGATPAPNGIVAVTPPVPDANQPAAPKAVVK